MFPSKIISIALLLITMSGCKITQQIKGSHNYESKEFTIKVTVYENNKKLNKAIDKKYGNVNHGFSVEGFSVWHLSKKDVSNMTSCEIYVTKPSMIGSPEFDTWGHELAHCIYGSYHGKPKKPK